jgi:zinc protease
MSPQQNSVALAGEGDKEQKTANASGSRASHFFLENGLEVLVIPDHRAPVVTHMVWYKVGAADEPPGKSGVAHFLEHLMFKGTKRIKPGEFSKIIARNGGRDNAFTTWDATAYHQRVAKDRLALVMELEADRMRNLRLDEKDVVTERDVILEERRSRTDNDPSSLLNEQMMAALYLAHPYGSPIIGWEHEIKALSRENALSFYRHYYAPNNAILIVAGDVTPDEVKKLAEKYYGPLKREEGILKRKRPKEPPAVAARRVMMKDERAAKPSLSRLYNAPSYVTAAPGEAEALDLLMKILGGGSTSRLYRQLVVKDKMASSIGGYYASSGLDYGRVGLYAIPAQGHGLDEVEKAMDAIIANIREKGVSERELERARNSYMAEYIYGVDSQASMARRYGWALVVGQSVADVEQWPQRLEKVTRDDILKVARKYLDIRASVTGHLEPERKKRKTASGDKDSKASRPGKG